MNIYVAIIGSICLIKFLNYLRVSNLTYKRQTEFNTLLHKLRMNVYSGKIDGSIKGVKLMDTILSTSIETIPSISLFSILYFFIKLRSKSLKYKEIMHNENHFLECPELQDIYLEYVQISKRYFISKSIFTIGLLLLPVFVFVYFKIWIKSINERHAMPLESVKAIYIKQQRQKLKYAMIMTESQPSTPHGFKFRFATVF